MRKIEIAYQILVGKPKVKDYLGDLGMYEKVHVILKWNIEKQGVNV
jgi:hypothetical protein